MPRPRPTEVKLIRSLITDQEWEDESELAAAIITALDEMRGRDRDYWALVVRRGGMLHGYGPFDTMKQADRAYLSGLGQTSEGDRAALVPLTPQARALAALEAAG